MWRALAFLALLAIAAFGAVWIADRPGSVTIVWNVMRASSRPCEISGWYGVYAVYQDGFSSTLRWMTAGVMVPW